MNCFPMKTLVNFFNQYSSVNFKTEILSGLTVAIALVPEAVAFALIAGLSPLTGLYAAFVMGLVTSIFGGRPGMISGATGAIAIVLVELAHSHGTEYIFATVILAGILQFLAGIMKLGKFMRLVPHPVIFGFVNGLAIIIFMSQIAQFKDPSGNWITGTSLYVFSSLVLLTMLIIWFIPRLTKAFPASLAAILVIFALVNILGIDTKTVGDIASIRGGFPPFHIPQLPFNYETLSLIFPYAAIVAGVGLIESLLTLNIIDEITDTRGNGNQEALAQGLANITSGLFSGMGGCAMIGQSLINISSGARERISGIVASLMLLVFILFGSSLVEQLPMAALTGLMIMVAIGTFEWASLRTLNKMPKSDISLMLVVTLITAVLHNLALAVVVGVILAAIIFAWKNAKHVHVYSSMKEDGSKHYEVRGPIFFASVTDFSEKFDITNDPDTVYIDFINSRVADMSAIEALNKLTSRYQKLGKKIHLKHLSRDCLRLLKNAEQIIDVNIEEDPRYKVAVDKI
jgi:sulfate permease, SulP family